MNRRNRWWTAMVGGAIVTGTVVATAGAAGAADADEWVRVDFDADLTSYLVNASNVKRTGETASLVELHVGGRTSISTGLGSHMLIERIFDCAAGTQKLGELSLYRALGARAEKIPHEDLLFKVQAGTMDEQEMKLACSGESPAVTAATVRYATLADAVRKAFADAIKLPSSQSNRTNRGMGAMGAGPPRAQPPGGGPLAAGAPPAGGAPP